MNKIDVKELGKLMRNRAVGLSGNIHYYDSYLSDSDMDDHTDQSTAQMFSHRAFDEIRLLSDLFRKKAEGSFLTKEDFIQNMKVVEPRMYTIECLKLFEVYDVKEIGYASWSVVVGDLWDVAMSQ